MAHSYDIETYNSQVSAVWRATLWLSIITIVEVAAALLWIYKIDPSGTKPKMLLNSFFIVASLLKAYFIVGEFMHVRYETRALALTILAPTVFLIWFVIAFLWEGHEWKIDREENGVKLENYWDKHAEEAKSHEGHH